MKTTLTIIASLLLFASCGTTSQVEEAQTTDTTFVATVIVADSAKVDTTSITTVTLSK